MPAPPTVSGAVNQAEERAFADLCLALPVEGLVPGDVSGTATLSQTLLRYEELFADAARQLGRVDVTWTGATADAFHREFRLQPAAFLAAASAFHTAGYALGSYVIALDSAREAAAVAVATFQRGVRDAVAARAAASPVGAVPAGGPLDLRAEPAGMQDRLAAVEKLAASRDAVDRAGETTADTLRAAVADAPAQVTALQHLGSFLGGVINPFAASPEREELLAGGARGLLDTAWSASTPGIGLLMPNPWGARLDDLEWKAGVNPLTGWHTAGAVVLPMAADGAGIAGAAAMWGGRLGRLHTEAEIAAGLEVAVPLKGVNRTPEDLYAFGNTQHPRPPRPGDLPSMMDGVIPAQPLPGRLPEGASTFIDPTLASLRGHYHRLPAGTDLPSGVLVLRDGRDMFDDSLHNVGHATIYTTDDITLKDFQQQFLALPWTHSGVKK